MTTKSKKIICCIIICLVVAVIAIAIIVSNNMKYKDVPKIDEITSVEVSTNNLNSVSTADKETIDLLLKAIRKVDSHNKKANADGITPYKIVFTLDNGETKELNYSVQMWTDDKNLTDPFEEFWNCAKSEK